MRVSYVDREGRKTRPSHWVVIPASKRHSNGLSQIKPYVARVLASTKPSSWAIFSTKSGNTSISVGNHEGQLSLDLTVEVKRPRSREVAIRRFFADRQILPKDDYLAANGGVPEATRVLGYPMPRNASLVAEIASDLLREIYHLSDTTSLDINFQESEAS